MIFIIQNSLARLYFFTITNRKESNMSTYSSHVLSFYIIPYNLKEQANMKAKERFISGLQQFQVDSQAEEKTPLFKVGTFLMFHLFNCETTAT